MEVGLFLLSAASLAFEVNLTRIFSVAQFYHFAFMTVSLALLGFGASGTVLSLAPVLARPSRQVLSPLSWAFALTAVASYVLTLQVPFDSFRVLLHPGQWGVLALHYLALSTPFLCTGLVVGIILTAHPGKAGPVYGANLAGSAGGCLVAVTAPALGGAEGMVLLCASLGGLAAIAFAAADRTVKARAEPRRRPRALSWIAQGALVAILAFSSTRPPRILRVRLSPYKGLSYALQYPDARVVFQAWNAVSRVDVVEAEAIRSLPGQGFACRGQPPPQRGLFVDGGDLSPITQVANPADLRPLTDCLLNGLPWRLRPGARGLVVEPRGGFDLLVALAQGAQTVTAVESNPLLVRAVQEQGAWAGDLYRHPGIETHLEDGRAYLARPAPRFDVILFSLSSAYHPITSGAYSLTEDYLYTVQGFVAALDRLEQGGLLAVVRWLQVPPSEEVRAFALAAEAVRRTGGEPTQSLVALRSFNQVLILARRGPFEAWELEQIRAFAAQGFFDLVYAPDVTPDEVNRYNVLPSPDSYLAFSGLLQAEDPARWLGTYPLDVTPPTDDRPFFGNFFRWRQAPEVLAMAGHLWQPFGGAGYLVVVALLMVASVAAGMLIVLPLAGRGKWSPAPLPPAGLGSRTGWLLAAFGFLGLAYLLVEIPLLQRFILFLGHPAYATAAVLGALLLFSGLGSLLSTRVPLGLAMGALIAGLLGYRMGLGLLSGPLLGLPLGVRFGVTLLGLAPLGMLMGMPFPHAVSLLQQRAPHFVPWAWGINGALSVVSSVLAALAALSWGFGRVLMLGAACYLGAWLTMALATRIRPRPDAPEPQYR